MKKVAYLILAHVDPVQLKRLVTALDYEAVFFVHVDAKIDIDSFISQSWKPNVHFVENRIQISWAGYKMVEATLGMMRKALDHEATFSHLVLLSGLDYPIKPVKVIHEYLQEHQGREIIKFIDMRESPHYLNHICRKYFKDVWYRGKQKGLIFLDKATRRILTLLRIPNRWNDKMIPFFGSQWWALTPECVRYVLDFVDSNPWFVRMNRFTFSPDEHFFHTIVGNSPFLKNSTGIQPFVAVGTFRMANLHLIHPSLAKVYTLDDLAELKTSDRFFARKFRTEESATVLDEFDKTVHFNR